MLDAIQSAVDAAAHGGHGSLVVLHGHVPRLAAALDDFGRPLEVVAGGFDVAGARGDFVTSTGERLDDPEALLALLRERLNTGRTVVLALDDVDLRIAAGALARRLPAAHAARRCCASTGSSRSPGSRCWTCCRSSTPPWSASPAATVDGDAAEAQLHAAFEHLGEEPAAKGYDLAVRTLRVAALEGTVFTVAALARVQGEDEDQLTDWLDDYLADDDGPLEDLGFVDGKERPLARYGFRDRAVLAGAARALGPAARPAHPRPLQRRAGRGLRTRAGGRLPRLGAGRRRQHRRVRAGGERVRHRARPRARARGRDERCRQRGARHRVVATGRDDDLQRRLLRYARALVELSDVGSTELYDLLGVVASREQWLGDAARCAALALAQLEASDAFAEVQRTIGLSGALLDLARWESGGEPRLGLVVDWLDAIAGDREALIAAAAQRLERAGVALEQVPSGDREHWRAHLQHAVAQLEAVRGDHEAARRGEERTLELLGEPPRESCNLRVLSLLALADAREELGDAAGARDAARAGVELSVGRSELDEAARGLAKVGRMELALGETQAGTQVIAFSLVIALELGMGWAEPGLWTQLARCLDGTAAQTCLALAGEGSAEVGSEALAHAASVRGDASELAFLEQVTGIGRDATEAFLGSLVAGEE